MHKKIQIAAIALLVLLTSLAAVTVQLYRRNRDQNQALYAQAITQADAKIKDSLRNACDALRNLQIYAANYVLTGADASLKTYRESLQDWQYEAGSLNLLSENDARGKRLRDFSEAGNQVANEMAAIISLYSAGSHDAALDRLRAAAAAPYRDKINRIDAPEHDAFGRAGINSLGNSRQLSRRLLYCAGGLSLLGFLSLTLLFYLLRRTTHSEMDLLVRAG